MARAQTMALLPMPERFLREVWQHGTFSSASLATSDGTRIAIRFPGYPNPDGGPDFRDALVRIGGVLYRGDVEIHMRAASWHAHRHDVDPHYNRVILHVVYFPPGRCTPARTASGRSIPLIVLSPRVDPLFYEGWMSGRDRSLRLVCGAGRRPLPRSVMTAKITALGARRIARRVRRLGRRFRQILEEHEAEQGNGSLTASQREEAWDQILYESVLEGMGYGGNRSPFLALARSVSLPFLRVHRLDDTLAMQALLFGTAGLLPLSNAPGDRESRAYVLRLRRKWQVLRPSPGVSFLQEGDWKFFRLRPVNFPTARLAAFCHLLPSLFAGRFMSGILDMLKHPGATTAETRRALFAPFFISPDHFWSHHVHFRGRAPGRGIALGKTRVEEIIVNTIVPLAILHARMESDVNAGRRAFALLRALPAPAENSVTRQVQWALTGGRFLTSSPLNDQGMLDLYRLYCSTGRCERCPVTAGPVVRTTAAQRERARGIRMSHPRSPARMSKSPRP